MLARPHDAQVENLKRGFASRRGIQLHVEVIGEDHVLLGVPYCDGRAQLEFDIIFPRDLPEEPPDFIFRNPQVLRRYMTPSSCSLRSVGLSLGEIEPLISWEARPDALLDTVSCIFESICKAQARAVVDLGIQSLNFECEYLFSEAKDVEALLVSVPPNDVEVNFLIPLHDLSDNGKGPPCYVSGERARLFVSYVCSGEGRCRVYPKVLLPSAMPRSSEALITPRWVQSEACFLNYIPLAISAISEEWQRRRMFLATLGDLVFGFTLAWDTIDHQYRTFLIEYHVPDAKRKSKKGGNKKKRMLSFVKVSIVQDFPAVSPRVELGIFEWPFSKVNPVNFEWKMWNPRWSYEEMGLRIRSMITAMLMP
eukprot:g3327.t1